MHITVTGSHGFIGSHLRQHLSKDNELNCWDTKIQKNIADFHIDRTDLIIHLAALAGIRESFEQADDFWKTNVEYTKHVFSVAEKSNKELELELLRLDPSGLPVTHTLLQQALKNLNTRIRNRGLSAQEMLL